jgi:hypothetical protein
VVGKVLSEVGLIQHGQQVIHHLSPGQFCNHIRLLNRYRYQ